ncbi:MAG: hypothetical protein ACYC99_16815 [Candidatus Geothermincolia bacterium]
MADRTEELRERVARLDSMHDDWLRKMQCAFGRLMVQACRFRLIRRFIAGPFAWFASYCIVERQLCGVERGRKNDVLDIAANYLKIPTLIRMPCQVAEAGDDRVLIEWEECAMGLETPDCIDACGAACEIDIATVKRLGGRLVVTENILEGAPKCVFEITRSD